MGKRGKKAQSRPSVRPRDKVVDSVQKGLLPVAQDGLSESSHLPNQTQVHQFQTNIVSDFTRNYGRDEISAVSGGSSADMQEQFHLPLNESFENKSTLPSSDGRDGQDQPIAESIHTPQKNARCGETEFSSYQVELTPSREKLFHFANDVTPLRQNLHGVRGSRINDHSFRRKRASQLSLRSVVQQVSRNAALSTKKAVWDSNEISVDAAIRAVDQWEALYTFLRNLTGVTLGQANNIYQATKSGALQMEQGILRPIRDWIVLPAFGGMEQAVLFLQSEQARQAANTSLTFVGMIPIIGENFLCPALCITGNAIQQSWEIVKYPIPSRQQVRETVGWTLDSSKWALNTAFREIFLYLKRADANITRTLSHTQWKVLGSGPYATLDDGTKKEVLSHITERYCSLNPLYDAGNNGNQTNGRMDLDCILARYELAAHIKRHNRPLYQDLIQSGLLQERGGTICEDDEWIKSSPIYRHIEANNFLIPESLGDASTKENLDGCTVEPLWFRLPCVNGKPPTNKDARWLCFTETEQHDLEAKYRRMVLQPFASGTDGDPSREDGDNDVDMNFVDEAKNSRRSRGDNQTTKHPTIAKWYNPDRSLDVMVDQFRHAVSLSFHCRQCKSELNNADQCSDFFCAKCDRNLKTNSKDQPMVPFMDPPPVSGLMRPTFWRFHGNGDVVRRSNWFLDTPRNGLQPFDSEAQSVLEDAYLFLKWIWRKKHPVHGQFSENFSEEEEDTFEGALLTVEVTCPDGAVRLVQFASLTRATAIQKGLSAAVSLNKLRVFRGAWVPKRKSREEEVQLPPQPVELSIQESIHQAASEHGVLGQTMVPNVCLRDILTPPPQPKKPIDRVTRFSSSQSLSFVGAKDLAVPTYRLFDERMVKHFTDPKGGNIDHLCLIVHGIGEMLQTIDLFGLALPNLSTIVDCCAFLRRNHTEVQVADFSEIYSTESPKQTLASVGRVEYLPIEWHEAFSIMSQRRNKSLQSKSEGSVMMKDLCLPTIPNMREFANDTLMDVLYFMSPEHHDVIVDIVANEMNDVVQRFRTYTGFSGKISIIGHSLGSVVTWDILNSQRSEGDEVLFQSEDHDAEAAAIPRESVRSLGGSSAASDYETARSDVLDDDPEINMPPPAAVSFNSTYAYPQLKFKVDNFFLLGSPVPVFLMIRNQRQPLSESFYLNGCRRVFNVFHPYDPVSYRLEPCIDPRNADFEPTIIKHWNGGFRVQYQTKVRNSTKLFF